MRFKRVVFGIGMVPSLLLLTSCSPSMPSESEGRAVLEQMFAGGGGVKVVGFSKTNGQSPDPQSYRMSFDGTYQVIDPQGYCRYVSVLECQQLPTGATFTNDGVISFQKSENGWLGEVEEW